MKLAMQFHCWKKKQTTVISLFNGHFWAIATAEACKGEAKLSSTLWIVAMSMICFCYVLLVSNMFDRKSTWNDDCYIISPRVTCFFQKLVAQPPEKKSPSCVKFLPWALDERRSTSLSLLAERVPLVAEHWGSLDAVQCMQCDAMGWLVISPLNSHRSMEHPQYLDQWNIWNGLLRTNIVFFWIQ